MKVVLARCPTLDVAIQKIPPGGVLLAVEAPASDAKDERPVSAVLVHDAVEQEVEDVGRGQVHPPVGYDDDIVVNTLGNLDFADVKVLEVRIHGLGIDEEFSVEWVMAPADTVRPVEGRTTTQPWVRNARPSRLTSAADVLPDTGTLRELLPDHDVETLVEMLQVEILLEEVADPEEEADQ